MRERNAVATLAKPNVAFRLLVRGVLLKDPLKVCTLVLIGECTVRHLLPATLLLVCTVTRPRNCAAVPPSPVRTVVALFPLSAICLLSQRSPTRLSVSKIDLPSLAYRRLKRDPVTKLSP